DSAGNVHIAYTAAGAKLYYMQRTAAGWSSQLITYTEPSFQPQVGEVGIALNSQNTPVITFAGDRIVYSILPVTIQNTPTPTPTATPVPTTSPTPTSTPTPTPAPDEETLIQDRKITGLKQQKRSLSWATTQGAVKYKVVVYKKAHNTYKKVKTYTAKTTHVKIAKKYRSTSGKKFYFRVRGVDGEGHLSKWSKYKKIK
ncbi:MAG TPA: hypothetical protein VJB65_02125, partial [Patescibacteria group bacterium]|nr:hypothetical protein [Patescibacteria group bacterium]